MAYFILKLKVLLKVRSFVWVLALANVMITVDMLQRRPRLATSQVIFVCLAMLSVRPVRMSSIFVKCHDAYYFWKTSFFFDRGVAFRVCPYFCGVVDATGIWE